MAALPQGVTARQFEQALGAAMPFFRRTEIDDTDLDAIAAYLTRNSGK